MHIIIHTDGGSRGNPGVGAVGVVITDEHHNKLASFAKKIGVVTNNEAEYQAVIEALHYVKSSLSHVTKIDFVMDSLLVCQQLRGLYKIKKTHLKELAFRVRTFEVELGVQATYRYVPRKENAEADRLLNQVLDEA